jgi:hypothetical protein
MVRMKAASIAVVACLSAAGLTACSVYESAPKRSCSPSYVAPSKYGNYSAQQAGPGRSIQWGIYPNFAASHYTVDVFMGSRRVDHKDQSYPPHGSVNAVDVRHHVDFTVSGTITRGKDHVYFDLTCTTA